MIQTKKSLILGAFLVFFLNYPVYGNDAAVESGVDSDPRLSEPFLWKAEKDGKVAYLFGTFHLGFELKDLPDEFFPLLNSSSLLFLETDTSEIERNPLLIQEQMFYLDGQSLDQVLSPIAWDNLKEEISTIMPLDENMLKTMRPAGVLMGIIFPTIISQLQLGGEIEKELAEYSKVHSIPVGYLEDVEVSLESLFALFSVESLEKSLTDKKVSLLESERTDLVNLYNCYQSSDLNCLEKMMQENYDENQSLEDSMKKRNQSWIPIIESALSKENQVFVAAGVGHFVLEDNVLDLLEQQGFTVEPVNL